MTVSVTQAWDGLAGARVLFAAGCGQPVGFLRGLADSRAGREGVELVSGILSGGYDFLDITPDAVRLTTWQLTPEARKRVGTGRIRVMPARYSRLAELFAPGGGYPVDVLVVHVSPPDADGTVSLGVSPSFCAPLARVVPRVVAVVNPRMPDTGGHHRITLSDVDAVVALDEPLPEFPSAVPNEVDRAIAENVATLIPDGATVQFGLGGVPEALPSFLSGKKDLGLYGMMTDAGMHLMASGVVPGPVEVGEIMGTPALFAYVDRNPLVRAVSTDVALAPETFRRIDRFVSVNSAVEVDVTGQVNAESIGHKLLSGPGGQLDYMEGAMLSPGGRAVIALPSTARDGSSRIVCHLGPGAVVTTPRVCVTHVVTEHGVAALEGRSLDERAAALIAVAAPSARAELRRLASSERGLTVA